MVAFRLSAVCIAIFTVFSLMADKKKQTPKERALAAQAEVDMMNIRNMKLDQKCDSLKQLISGERKSPLENTIEALRQELAQLKTQEAALGGKMEEQGQWAKDYLPKLIEERKALMEQSVFEMKENELEAYKKELEPFSAEPQAQDMLKLINKCLGEKEQIAALSTAVDSPLTPAKLQDAKASYADLGKSLSEEDAGRLKDKFEIPLNDYAACAPTFLGLVEGFNSYKQVKGMRRHVAKNPGSAGNYSGKILDFFAQYSRENADKIKSLQSVPYFKHRWEAYASQLRNDPFTAPGAVEAEIAGLGYQPLPQ